MQFKLALCVVVSLASLVFAQDRNLATVKKAFTAAHIPSDIHINFNPRVLFEVSFPQTSGPAIPVHAGLQLPRNATAGPPRFSIRSNALATRGPFVVATVDPDAPTPQTPTSAQIRHFLGGNFHLGPTGRLTNSTAAISNFLQPTPPAGSDPHRYVFLLFEQPRGFNQQKLVNSTTSIANFNISSFAAAVGLGQPIGGTFIRVGPDPSA
ncbi:PEBP-like protein [Cristinia sonorae]|uniref:PEBP-like protein n=1 Tax=Cristinia sonorae TaxID=1940300 RepID=A0A8K0UFD5_9AGAR|nr:PEBP-like protein [Cristinia sonorae]